MATLVKVRKWGNSLGLRLPKSFASQRSIVDGATVQIDSLKLIESPPRKRSNYELKSLLKKYAKPPKQLDFPPAGKELV
jgi:antitoxin component of MazEF toxin-antitoxin module